VPGSDYVFIARQGTADRAWERLLDDVKSALTRLATPSDQPVSGRPATVALSSDTPHQDRGPA
jgi:ribonuclease P protein component